MLPHINHDLDVEGDVILTLENPNEPFAVWVDEGEPWEVPPSSPPVLDDRVLRDFRSVDPACDNGRKKHRKTKRLGFENGFSQFGFDVGSQDEMPRYFQASPVEQPAPSYFQEEAREQEVPETTEGSEVQVDLSNLAVEKTSAVSKRTEFEDDEVISNEASPIQFRLSSRHLILASPYFRAMLTGPWLENASRTDSFHNTSATGWDEDAFELLMNIIQGNSQKVPRSISLELLAKIALLVDYYKCYDVVKFYSDTWIENLGNAMEVTRYSRDFVLVLFVSCVFFQRTAFRKLTNLAMQQTQGPLRTLSLPFPQGLIGLWPNMLACRAVLLMVSAEDIERTREKAVGRLLDGFQNLLQYLNTRDHCNSDCNAILVGLLHREMSKQGFLSPRPARPFHGISVERAIQMAQDAGPPKKSNDGGFGGHYTGSHLCSIDKFLDPLTSSVTGKLEGLDLESYVSNPWVITGVSGPDAQLSSMSSISGD